MGLAAQYGRYGYKRVTGLLREARWRVNKERVERIWRREGLKVPARQPKRGRLWFNEGSCVGLRPEYPNHVWAYDFLMDRTHDGKAFRRLAGVPRIHVHGLRHTFGSRMAMAGADPFAIMKAVGHADIKTTMIYVSLGKSHIREQVKRLNSIIVPESACTSPTSGTGEHAYLPRASRMQRTQGV